MLKKNKVKKISKKNIVDIILSNSLSNNKLAKHSQSDRIKNIGDIDNNEFKKILVELFKIDINSIQVIAPGPPANLSLQFYTFSFYYNSKNYKITLAGNKIPGEDIEMIQVNYINNFIKNIGKNIDILIDDEGGKNPIIFKNIYGIKKIPGNKHADFEFLSNNKNKLFIQHKDFKYSQQYCGFSKISYHEDINIFIDNVKKISKEFKPKEKYCREIKDPILKKQAIYGIDENGYGKNRVNAIYFGNLQLKSTNNIENSNEFKLISDKYFTDRIIPNEEYSPYLFATYRNDNNQQGIKYCRFGVYPKKFLKALDPIIKNTINIINPINQI
jgi:hypothetical protein